MDLGRRIERASHLAWLVRQTVLEAGELENDNIRTVLEIADSAMTYRSRYLNQIQIVPFVDLLLLDEVNPRSVAFQLAAIEHHLHELPRITLAQRNDVPGSLAAEVRMLVANTHPARVSVCEHGARALLGEFTDTIREDVAMLSDAIADAYFQHASRRRTGAAARLNVG
jgi:uncharacterized alpha-E superfamily protein